MSTNMFSNQVRTLLFFMLFIIFSFQPTATSMPTTCCWLLPNRKLGLDLQYDIREKSSNSLHHKNLKTKFYPYTFSNLQRATSVSTSSLVNTSSSFGPYRNTKQSCPRTWRNFSLTRRFRELLQSVNDCVILPFCLILFRIISTTCDTHSLVKSKLLHSFLLASEFTISRRNLSALRTEVKCCVYNSQCKTGTKGANIVLFSWQAIISSTFSLLFIQFPISSGLNGTSSKILFCSAPEFLP